MTKYAVLISGITVEASGLDEFWNDVVRMRNALLANGFSDGDIYVLYGKGAAYSSPLKTNPEYLPAKITTVLPGTTAGVIDVFQNILPKKITNSDTLFIWTFGHGLANSANQYYLVLNDGNMDNATFEKIVNSVSYAFRIIWMQQCFSGGFITSNLVNDGKTVIFTACTKSEISRRCDDKNPKNQPVQENERYNNEIYNHGEFNHHLHKKTNPNANATMKDIFDFVVKNNSIKSNHPQKYCTVNLEGKTL